MDITKDMILGKISEIKESTLKKDIIDVMGGVSVSMLFFELG